MTDNPLNRKLLTRLVVLGAITLIFFQAQFQHNPESDVLFDFDDNVQSRAFEFKGDRFSFTEGLIGKALSLNDGDSFSSISSDEMNLSSNQSFSVMFWVKMTSGKPTILLSQKEFLNKGISSQKKPGWAIYTSGGSLAWCVGSGSQRINYELDFGKKLSLNDGMWHHIAFTYDKERSEIRSYKDGKNSAVYHAGFDFISDAPLVIGAIDHGFDFDERILPEIIEGAALLQNYLDAFNQLDKENVKKEEFLTLITNPKELYVRKQALPPSEIESFLNRNAAEIKEILDIRESLRSNYYTEFQNKKLTRLRPISKIYAISGDSIIIDKYQALKFTQEVRLFPSKFSMDNLSIWHRALSGDEIRDDFEKLKPGLSDSRVEKVDSLTVAVWNIWHGGKHFNYDEDGWDSRIRIIEMLRNYKADIVLMQETYSSGEDIAASLGYYFASTSDFDNVSQGSNISVISRYPILELEVPEGAEFMNVSAKLALSTSQAIYAMSNWYGMYRFQTVFDHHRRKFDQADSIPILFGGDFNAVPHLDGGDSPASIKLEKAGFQDGFRKSHPDVKAFPGYSHEWGERIDQLYFKGSTLKHQSTEVISTARGGFPSDHFLIISKFKINQ